MNRDEAKFILRAYRGDGQDMNDPQFREALELAKHDPELARWFAEEQAMDISITNKVRAFPVPPSLKAQLLAARKVLPLPVWWRRPVWQAAAACLALLIGIGVFLFQQSTHRDFAQGQTSFAQYRDTMADFTGNKLSRLDLKSRDVREIRQWLTQKNAHGNLLLPASLEGRPGVGCRVLNWGGKTVSLVCFELENHRIAHLLVIDREVFKDAPAESPQFAQVVNVATVTWSRDDKIYLLACKKISQQELLRLM